MNTPIRTSYELINTCTEYMWETCTGSTPATVKYNYHGVSRPMCVNCYEWLHGRLDPIKIK